MRYRRKELYLMCLNNTVNILCFTAIFIATVALIIFYSDASNLIKKVTQNNKYVIVPKETIENIPEDEPVVTATTERNKNITNIAFGGKNVDEGNFHTTKNTPKLNEYTTKKSIAFGYTTKKSIPFAYTTKKTLTPVIVTITKDNKIDKSILTTKPCKMLPQRDDDTKCGSRKADMKCCEYIWAMHYKDDILEHLKCNTPSLSYEINDSPAEFPHMAAVGWLLSDRANTYNNNQFSNKYVFKCSGSLISNKFVLTSASCIYTNDNKTETLEPKRTVRLGWDNISESIEDNVQDIIEKLIYHPEYLPQQAFYDIALLKLKSPLIFTKKIHPACISTSFSTSRLTKVNVTGWEETNFDTKKLSGRLQYSTLDIISHQACLTKLEENEVYNDTWKYLHMQQLCAGIEGGRNGWQGNSGSPIQVKIDTASGYMHTVIGVTSMTGLKGSTDLPGIYISVSSVLSWIEKTVWPEDEKDEFT